MRKKCLILGMLLVSILIVPLAWSQNPYEPYAGTTIVASFPSHIQYEPIKQLIPEFEKETGIRVEVDWLEYMRMREKHFLEMSKPVGDYDLISLVCMWKAEYVTAGLLQELAPFFANPALANPNYDLDDIFPVYLTVTGKVGGEKGYLDGPGAALYAIPWGSETSILAYRKDLFEEYGLTPPDTYDELIDIAEFFAKEVPDIYGLTIRGQSGHQAGHSWLNFAAPFGAKVFDENWEPVFNQEPALEALRYMQKIVETGPPGIPAFDYDAMSNAFLRGTASMYLDTTAIFGLVRDPSKSKVVGKVGYGLHPKHLYRKGETGGFGIAIPNNSQHKEAAFLFLQWLTSKETSKKAVALGLTPFRISTSSDPELQAQYPELAIYLEAVKYADPDWRPIIAVWDEINNEHLGIAINKVMTGELTPEEAMNSQIEPVREIMRKAGYYMWQK